MAFLALWTVQFLVAREHRLDHEFWCRIGDVFVVGQLAGTFTTHVRGLLSKWHRLQADG